MSNDINIIVACGKDGAIGKKDSLIWRIPADLKRFKTLTMGHPVIMGRKTWDSLPKKPLPGRRNIVLTRRSDYEAEGAEIVNSIEEALNITKGESPFIIGGAEIYNSFMPFATHLFLTLVEEECPDADAWFHIDFKKDWEEKKSGQSETTTDGVVFKYIEYQRK